jgi:hypothetical protein
MNIKEGYEKCFKHFMMENLNEQDQEGHLEADVTIILKCALNRFLVLISVRG